MYANRTASVHFVDAITSSNGQTIVMDVRHMHMFASIVLYFMQNYPSTKHNHAQDKVTMNVWATHLPRSLCAVFVSLIKYSGTAYQSYVNIILLQKCVMNESFRGCQIIGNSIQYDFMLLKIQPRNKQRTQRTHRHTHTQWGTKWCRLSFPNATYPKQWRKTTATAATERKKNNSFVAKQISLIGPKIRTEEINFPKKTA